MTKGDKELLFVDLCARLPYKTFAQWHHKALNKFRDVKIMKISTYGESIDDYYINVLCQPEPGADYEASIVDIKPYLRPLSSMTKDEKKELGNYAATSMIASQNKDPLFKLTREALLAHFFNKHHFDYHGLIEDGLALEAPEGMYKF